MSKQTLDFLVKPNPEEGYISVNAEFLQTLKDEKARGETKIADAFKTLIGCAVKAAREGKI